VTAPRRPAFRPLALVALALGLLGAGGASAQVLAVRSSDTVLLVRTYARHADGSTQPTARFGLVLARDAVARRVEVQAAGAPAHAIAVDARRRDDGAVVDWQLLAAGSAEAHASGSTRVARAASAHVELGQVGDVEVYAALEAGRGSDFDLGRIQAYFQPGYLEAVAAAASEGFVQPPPSAPPSPSALTGAVLDLAFRVEADGRTLAAPRVRVANGEQFAIEVGSSLAIVDGTLHEGLIVSGTPRHEAGVTWLDLSVQSGRRLDVPGPVTYLVDRFRQGLELPDGQEVVLELFGDVPGAPAGALRLFVTAAPN
jgi:hypothetical protein